MQFFKHPCDARFRPFIKHLEKKYGWAGVGFYWRIVEVISDYKIKELPLKTALSWTTSGLGNEDKKSIIKSKRNKIFYVDIHDTIRLRESKNSTSRTHPCADPIADTDAGGDAGGDVGLRAVPFSTTREENKEKKKNKKEILNCQELLEQADTDEERDFYANMMEHYPRICQMKLPLTYEQLKRLLRDGHTYEELNWTLIQMENYLPLLQKCVSANLTIRNWIRRTREYSTNKHHAQNY